MCNKDPLIYTYNKSLNEGIDTLQFKFLKYLILKYFFKIGINKY